MNNEQTNQNSIKVPKFVYQTNKKTLVLDVRDKSNKQPNWIID